MLRLVPVIIVLINGLCANRLYAQSSSRDSLKALYPDTKIYVLDNSLDIMPQPRGGMEVLRKYLKGNIRYPREAKQAQVKGIVYTAFQIDQDGNIKNVRIIEGLGHGWNEQVLKALENAPGWVPAEKNGAQVPVDIVFPIQCPLEDIGSVGQGRPGNEAGDPMNKDLFFNTEEE